MKISGLVAAQRDFLVDTRRHLHQIPEEAFQEKETSGYIRDVLGHMRPDRLESMAGTGTRAVFGADLPGPAVAIRADMDALPVTEDTNLPFASRHPGVMHACGHDGHMAMALTAAKIVSENREALKRPFVFLFQPAEETTGGAWPMIQQGALKNPDVSAIYGAHLWPYLEQGMVGIRPGTLMGALTDFDVHIEGRSCHGARPQGGVDAIVAAAQLVLAVQTIVSRNVDPLDAAILTIGRVSGGEARNIVAAEATVEATTRAFRTPVMERIIQRVHEVCRGLEEMCGVRCRYEESMSYPPVDNSRELFEEAVAVLPKGSWREPEPVMISEDFAFYQKEVPGLFAFIGTGAPGHEESLHSSRFTFDEDVLCTGVEYFLQVTRFL